MINKKEYGAAGIPDSFFARGTVPMTKEEIRVITLSKARLIPGLVVWDVGSGTGSISVEAARMTPGGMVYAVEKSSEGCRLTRENSLLFGVENIQVIMGEAPGALDGLPSPDRVIIGGSGGMLKSIIRSAQDRLNLGGRIVINAVTLDTLGSSLECLQGGWETEVIQVSISKAQVMGASRLMKAYNPVYVITAWRCGV
ncbi:MAG: nucleotide-binding protein [Peptococcaceae bacterium BICA1-7]|nr:MAG: nucleotide-binding protein [Peptococcaceae bacterium BICA1-7]HBV96750.1 precorrin-6Y C5,15-methyltransferase (decarboxylating) subunit CbiT [Desulfotomaculum sp.]